jgi:hypothetical protein
VGGRCPAYIFVERFWANQERFRVPDSAWSLSTMAFRASIPNRAKPARTFRSWSSQLSVRCMSEE